MLVTVARYRVITGDETSGASAVSDAILDATAMLEEELGRPLEEAERIEAMRPAANGRLYPLATPIESVAGGYTIDGSTLFSGPFYGPYPDPITGTSVVTVTYTGGYVERTANPTAANRLPVHVERDIAVAARRLLSTPVLSAVPSGATSVRLGDAAVTFGDDNPDGGGEAQIGGWSAMTLRLRRRRL